MKKYLVITQVITTLFFAAILANLTHPFTNLMPFILQIVSLLLLLTISGVVAGFIYQPLFKMLLIPEIPPKEFWDNPKEYLQNNPKQRIHIIEKMSMNMDNETRQDIDRLARQNVEGLIDKYTQEILPLLEQSTKKIRQETMKRSVLTCILMPTGRADTLILIWLNCIQIYKIASTYGFRPSPIGLVKLYSGVLAGALIMEGTDELMEEFGEEHLAQVGASLSGGIPVLGSLFNNITSLGYEALKAGTYSGLIALYTKNLCKNGLTKLPKGERTKLRREARSEALTQIPEIFSQLKGEKTTTV